MAFLGRIKSLWYRLFHMQRIEVDLDEEIRSTLELLADQRMEEGMNPEDARRAAGIELGGVEHVKEEVRAVRTAPSLDSLLQDIRFALRMLRKSPAFTIVAVLTLALGIGANAAIFTLIDAVMLRTLPVKQPGQLVELFHVHPTGPRLPLTFPMFQELQRRQQVFTSVFGWSYGGAMHNVQVGDSLTLRGAIAVTGTFYSELGVTPALGRLIVASDADPALPPSPVAVISYQYWRNQFNASPSALGAQILVEGQPFTIIGVTPKNFSAMETVAGPDVTVPINAISLLSNGGLSLTAGGNAWLNVAGRLRDGVTIQRALAQLSTFWPQLLAAAVPPNYTGRTRTTFLASHVEAARAATGEENSLETRYSEQLFILMGMVGVLLFAACLNLTSLLLARATMRSHEMSVRAAVGASRWRLVQQTAIESLLVSAAGALLALALAQWASRTLSHFITRQYLVPVTLDLKPDLRVLTVTAAFAILAGLLCATAPSWRAARQDAASALKQTPGASSRTGRAGRILVVMQVAISIVLLFGAGLLAHSMDRLFSANPGFQGANVLMMELQQRPGGYKDFDSGVYHRELLERIGAIPGVSAAAWSNVVPGYWFDDKVSVSALQGQRLSQSDVSDGFAGPGFFDAIGVPIISGRDFAWSDNEHAPRVAILNSKLASQLFPSGDAIGGHIHLADQGASTQQSDLEVIGVVNDGRLLDFRVPQKSGIYLPSVQLPMDRLDFGSGSLFVRIAANRDEAIAQIRHDVAALGHEYVFRVMPDDDILKSLLLPERVTAILSACFAGIALLLSLIGLYGLMCYAVASRTREIGIRMALGAQRANILKRILAESVVLTLIGIAVGLPCAIAAARIIQSMLFGLSRADVDSLALAIGALLSIGIIAGYIPARRAMRVDPMVALRHE
jgi:predicted permease